MTDDRKDGPADAQGVEPVAKPDMVMVPRENTEEMHEAFFRARDEYEQLKANRVFPRPALSSYVWDAMLAAAPVVQPLHTAPPPDQARREALESIAQRIDSLVDVSVYYSLQQTPRVLPNVPTLVEESLEGFRGIARYLRALASPAPAAAQKGDEP
jgi:hypothetical protein